MDDEVTHTEIHPVSESDGPRRNWSLVALILAACTGLGLCLGLILLSGGSLAPSQYPSTSDAIVSESPPAPSSLRHLPTNPKALEFFVGSRQTRLQLTFIPGGSCNVGSLPDADLDPQGFELPRHEVTVAPFYMALTETTQAQFEAVMSLNPSASKGHLRPVEMVSWQDAVEFCAALSAITHRTFRLPSETEWEHACRAGSPWPYYYGQDSRRADDHAWSARNAVYGVQEVGLKIPNRFGLYDMLGNIWEWVADPWHSNYEGAPSDGSVWSEGGEHLRYTARGGGAIVNSPEECRCSGRSTLDIPSAPDHGFRVVCEL